MPATDCPAGGRVGVEVTRGLAYSPASGAVFPVPTYPSLVSFA